ncbi:hypothetical protein FJQ98_11820 [Lysinibacillus agricola]|uniref:Uncharacterized protein n=1 Tax=Lysinibacillus agricola TaxID=2590012 RepID=A0ABX7AXV6_9BACI|nr:MULTISPECIES: hypothetical protein [Lysinibacillus]QQP14624.1 hypothetical protein FJQ98_11820 [Lysinibacillus agricola]
MRPWSASNAPQEALRESEAAAAIFYLCESEATATIFYLCESEATATTNVFCSESEAAATIFYLCESEATATKRPVGMEINLTVMSHFYNLLVLTCQLCNLSEFYNFNIPSLEVKQNGNRRPTNTGNKRNAC